VNKLKLTGKLKKEHETHIKKIAEERLNTIKWALVGLNKEELRAVKNMVEEAIKNVGR